MAAGAGTRRLWGWRVSGALAGEAGIPDRRPEPGGGHGVRPSRGERGFPGGGIPAGRPGRGLGAGVRVRTLLGFPERWRPGTPPPAAGTSDTALGGCASPSRDPRPRGPVACSGLSPSSGAWRRGNGSGRAVRQPGSPCSFWGGPRSYPCDVSAQPRTPLGSSVPSTEGPGLHSSSRAPAPRLSGSCRRKRKEMAAQPRAPVSPWLGP